MLLFIHKIKDYFFFRGGEGSGQFYYFVRKTESLLLDSA